MKTAMIALMASVAMAGAAKVWKKVAEVEKALDDVLGGHEEGVVRLHVSRLALSLTA